MKTVWIVCRLLSDRAFEIDGAFTNKEEALAICDDKSAAVELEIGRDYREVCSFVMATLATPAGVVG